MVQILIELVAGLFEALKDGKFSEDEIISTAGTAIRAVAKAKGRDVSPGEAVQAASGLVKIYKWVM